MVVADMVLDMPLESFFFYLTSQRLCFICILHFFRGSRRDHDPDATFFVSSSQSLRSPDRQLSGVSLELDMGLLKPASRKHLAL